MSASAPLDPGKPIRPKIRLSRGSQMVLEELLKVRAWDEIMCSDGTRWSTVFLSNVTRPETMDIRIFVGHLAALRQAGYYRQVDGVKGLVLVIKAMGTPLLGPLK